MYNNYIEQKKSFVFCEYVRLEINVKLGLQLILDRISKGINEKVKKSGAFRAAVFNFAYQYKLKWLKRGYDTPLFDKYIFGAAKQVLGGKVRLILSGGAPLTPETHMQMKICLCLTVTQGYGLTETCACATVMDGVYLIQKIERKKKQKKIWFKIVYLFFGFFCSS